MKRAQANIEPGYSSSACLCALSPRYTAQSCNSNFRTATIVSGKDSLLRVSFSSLSATVRPKIFFPCPTVSGLANKPLTTDIDSTINSTTWLYGSEVLPVAIRSKVMGLAATSHYVVNVGSELTPFQITRVSTSTYRAFASHRSWAQRLCEHRPELLLRLRWMLHCLFVYSLFLIPVSTFQFRVHLTWCADCSQGNQSKDARGNCGRVR